MPDFDKITTPNNIMAVPINCIILIFSLSIIEDNIIITIKNNPLARGYPKLKSILESVIIQRTADMAESNNPNKINLFLTASKINDTTELILENFTSPICCRPVFIDICPKAPIITPIIIIKTIPVIFFLLILLLI